MAPEERNALLLSLSLHGLVAALLFKAAAWQAERAPHRTWQAWTPVELRKLPKRMEAPPAAGTAAQLTHPELLPVPRVVRAATRIPVPMGTGAGVQKSSSAPASVGAEAGTAPKAAPGPGKPINLFARGSLCKAIGCQAEPVG